MAHSTPVEVFVTRGAALCKDWKAAGKVPKVFDKVVKSFVYVLEGRTCSLQAPEPPKKSLALRHPFLVLQVLVPPGAAFGCEIGVSDISGARHRLILSTSFRELSSHTLHVQVPLTIPRGQWMHLCVNIPRILAHSTQSAYATTDSLFIHANCSLRAIFTLPEFSGTGMEIPLAHALRGVDAVIVLVDGSTVKVEPTPATHLAPPSAIAVVGTNKPVLPAPSPPRAISAAAPVAAPAPTASVRPASVGAPAPAAAPPSRIPRFGSAGASSVPRRFTPSKAPPPAAAPVAQAWEPSTGPTSPNPWNPSSRPSTARSFGTGSNMGSPARSATGGDDVHDSVDMLLRLGLDTLVDAMGSPSRGPMNRSPVRASYDSQPHAGSEHLFGEYEDSEQPGGFSSDEDGVPIAADGYHSESSEPSVSWMQPMPPSAARQPEIDADTERVLAKLNQSGASLDMLQSPPRIRRGADDPSMTSVGSDASSSSRAVGGQVLTEGAAPFVRSPEPGWADPVWTGPQPSAEPLELAAVSTNLRRSFEQAAADSAMRRSREAATSFIASPDALPTHLAESILASNPRQSTSKQGPVAANPRQSYSRPGSAVTASPDALPMQMAESLLASNPRQSYSRPGTASTVLPMHVADPKQSAVAASPDALPMQMAESLLASNPRQSYSRPGTASTVLPMHVADPRQSAVAASPDALPMQMAESLLASNPRQSYSRPGTASTVLPMHVADPRQSAVAASPDPLPMQMAESLLASNSRSRPGTASARQSSTALASNLRPATSRPGSAASFAASPDALPTQMAESLLASNPRLTQPQGLFDSMAFSRPGTAESVRQPMAMSRPSTAGSHASGVTDWADAEADQPFQMSWRRPVGDSLSQSGMPLMASRNHFATSQGSDDDDDDQEDDVEYVLNSHGDLVPMTYGSSAAARGLPTEHDLGEESASVLMGTQILGGVEVVDDADDRLELLYDPALGCYYDPKNDKYYELSGPAAPKST